MQVYDISVYMEVQLMYNDLSSLGNIMSLFSNPRTLDKQLYRLLGDLEIALAWERSPAGQRERALEKEQADAKAAADVNAQKAESEFYIEVKEALMAEGRAEHVAGNLIRTEALLLEQARRLEII